MSTHFLSPSFPHSLYSPLLFLWPFLPIKYQQSLHEAEPSFRRWRSFSWSRNSARSLQREGLLPNYDVKKILILITSFFLVIHFKITLPSTHSLPSGHYLQVLWFTFCIHFSCLPCMLHASFRRLSFYHHNCIWREPW
jgi:hypothetical protein